MKPSEEMHAAVEEVDLDPCDLYTDLGTLIVEGRVPGVTEKGFGEGLHCSSTHGQNRHQCDPSSPECQKYEQILKHMLLLWKNGIPMTIEVLLYPSCCSPFPNVDSVPDMPYLLLEQWTIHMLPRRVPDASISPRGLIQAVRSFLYFSQLCAWYSLTGGKSPQNVHYRVCVPGEAFSSKFSTQPDCHMFPVANIGRNSAMKVLMKCHPRCGEIPTVPCHKHSKPNLPLKTLKGSSEVYDLHNPSPGGSYALDGILPTGMASRTSSPADSMLGESLLDPPNSLCMYPKRYQSPSRCGSPSIEVPEHLMFGKTKMKQEESTPQRRSRPQRRPVVERFLKKNLGNSLCSSTESKARTFDKQIAAKDKPPDIFSLKRDAVLNYCTIEDCMKHVPKDELDQVLERLRSRHCWKKRTTDDRQSLDVTDLRKEKNLHNKPLESYFENMTLDSDKVDQNKDRKQNPFAKGQNQNSSKQMSKQPLWLSENNSIKKICDKKTKFLIPSEKLSSFPSIGEGKSHNNGGSSNLEESQSENSLTYRLNLQNNIYSDFKGSRSNIHSKLKTDGAISENSRCFKKQTYQHDCNDSPKQLTVHSKCSSVNIKKCGAFLSKNVNEIDGERELDIENQILDDKEAIQEIPSAEKKAIFRRSLDSATSLVFHKRSGLPLTSSPAPTRKNGTSFDYDSTLTSVSAIKRALFEKQLEQDVQEEEINNQLSTSAPASIFSSSLLGTFEESVLNGRLEPVSTVEGFTAEIGASGSFCPNHVKLPVTVFFYTLHDMDKVASPYMGHINLRSKDYHIPKKGTVQVTLFNPHETVVKMFVVRYDLSDMPINCQTFLRQRTLYMPADASESDPDAQKWLRYLVHLRFMSSKSGRIYLHTDIRLIIFRKSDLDAATVHGQRPYELRTFTHGPSNPKFSPHKP
ncbi:atos homolog protein A-like isoform X1 [Argiope bruennichi]|uniref:atos homolog protein A-like isoform X1 n=2 Tax=Argiope bruennichi TaxID=94029 RepID=UPI0024944BD4|nr:atos homolog protein A-like isoform X1 [Argiope bruennichi]